MPRRSWLGLTWGAVLLCTSLWLRPDIAQADAFRSIETSSPQEVVSGMANKATRGVANLATGWLELPKQVYVTTKEDGWMRGVLVGPLKGIGMTIVRTLSGAVETVTFIIPYPGFYDPFFDPEFVWQKE